MERLLQPAPLADDLTLARRLSLALTGSVPSLEEIRAFEAQPAATRMEWWMNRLLADRRTADYLAERFARAYVGTEDGPFLVYRRRRFASWLSDRLHTNQPYDQTVREMVAGQGLWTNKPSVNFLTATISEGRPDPVRLAGRTSRALLGLRIDCLQCHDDRLGNVELGEMGQPREGLQSDFHQLAAFFADADVSLVGVRDKQQEYLVRYLDEENEQSVPARPPYRADLMPDQGSRRSRLAAWVTHPENRPLAREAVNRFWALLFGRPLVEPVDDISLHGPFPPGLELLVDDFIEHGYDSHRLLRIMAGSAPFRRDSRAVFRLTQDHETHWAAFPLSRLRPEQVAGALVQSCSVKTLDSHAHIVFQLLRSLQTNEFVGRYGDIGEDEFDDRGGTIPQRLLLMNGRLVRDSTRGNLITNAAAQIATFAGDDPRAVESAYLAVLTRRPSPIELEKFVARLGDRSAGSRRKAVEDLYWVLVNSTEFSWNH
jgi:hypothetical protein